MEEKNIYGKLAVVKLDVHIWSGRKKLRPEDLEGVRLPPQELASLGSKKIIDPQRIAVLHRLKKEAERECLRAGTRFLGGFAIPDGKLAGVLAELKRIQDEFGKERSRFLAQYEEAVEEWTAQYPDFADIIRTAIAPISEVAESIGFDWTVFRVEPHPQDSGRLDGAASKLGSNAMLEVAQEANRLLEESILGQTEVTRRVLNPLKRIRDKLDGLSFVDSALGPIVDRIDGLLASIRTTPIQGSDLDRLLAIVQLLADPVRMRKHGNGLVLRQDFVPLPGQPAQQAPGLPGEPEETLSQAEAASLRGGERGKEPESAKETQEPEDRDMEGPELDAEEMEPVDFWF